MDIAIAAMDRGNNAADGFRSCGAPAILRFASDEFMDQFLNVGKDPAPGRDRGQPETWRGPTKEQEPIKPAPVFARKLQRLGLLAQGKRASHHHSLLRLVGRLAVRRRAEEAPKP